MTPGIASTSPATDTRAIATRSGAPAQRAHRNATTLSLVPPLPSASLPEGASAARVAAARLADRARADLEAGDIDRALERLEQGLRIEPDSPFTYYYLAVAYLRLQRGAEALVLAERATALSVDEPAAWTAHSHALRGRAYEMLDRAPQARQAYRKALRTDPNNLPARAALERLDAPRG